MNTQKNLKAVGQPEEKGGMMQQKEVYIYAQVDIDKAYNQVLNKSKRIRNYLQQRSLGLEFTQKMRNYKNFRICFDYEIQNYIHRKELNNDLRLIKKNVFNALEEFIIKRYELYIQEERLHFDYKVKVDQIQKKFTKRFEELLNHAKTY